MALLAQSNCFILLNTLQIFSLIVCIFTTWKHVFVSKIFVLVDQTLYIYICIIVNIRSCKK